MKNLVYTVYSEESDLTFIMEDALNGDDLVSTECKGFYHGRPNTDDTIKFYGKLQATFKQGGNYEKEN